jgi:hypothetical protein
MAGTIVADTISDGAGNTTSMDNAIYGSAKAWVNFQGGNGNTAGTINGSFNVSSVTANATGDFTVNFTTAFANTNYATITGLQNSTGNRASSTYASTTSSASVYTYACSSGANSSVTDVFVACFR